MTWKHWAFPYCRRTNNHLPQDRKWRVLMIEPIDKPSFLFCCRNTPLHGWLMRRFVFAGSLRLTRAGLQSLELLHFMLCGCCFSLFPIDACEREMRLRREWSFLLDGKKLGPFFLGSCGVAFE